MKAKTPVLSIYFDNRSPKINGTCPVKLRVFFDGEVKFYSLGIDLLPQDFERSYLSEKPRKDFKEKRDNIITLESKAKEIVKNLPVFSFEVFRKKFYQHSNDKTNVFAHYTSYIERLKGEDRVSTAMAYNVALKSLQQFITETKKGQLLPFADVTPEFLLSYEKWMLKQGKSISTVGIYLRPLRAVFHAAIQSKDITTDVYPFGKGRYVIPAGQNIKKALDRGELKKLFQAKPQNEQQEKARDFWFFSYQCNGINVADICALKFKNLQPDKILFIRQKTAGTTKAKQKTITVMRTPLINGFINKYGNSPGSPEDYVFPVYTREMDTTEKHRERLKFICFINDNVKALARSAGLSDAISSYSARHSFATVLLNSGASVAFIQDALGHMDSKTTANYLKGFDDETKARYADKLMDF